MVGITLLAGLVLLLPNDLEDLAESTVAQQLMLANVYFWRNTGYFDGPAELKPLLHTWSLAVEEQFYLGFPFLSSPLQATEEAPSFDVAVWPSRSFLRRKRMGISRASVGFLFSAADACMGTARRLHHCLLPCTNTTQVVAT